MKKKLTVFICILVLLTTTLVSIFSYAYFSATIKNTNTAVINTTLPNGSYTFKVTNTGTLTQSFTSNKKLSSSVNDTVPVVTGNVNLEVSLTAPDNNTNVLCYYDLIWEWTGTDTYTSSDVTLSLTKEIVLNDLPVYNYEYSVKANSTTTGSPDNTNYGAINAFEETDLSNFTWNGTKAVIRSEAVIVSNNVNTPTVTKWNITSNMYNINATQTKLQGKEFKSKIYVDNVNCNVMDATNITKPTVVSGDLNTIGSEVALGDEHFYIINSTDTTITMLAKYNLLVGYKNALNSTEIYSSSDEGYGFQSEMAKGYSNSSSQWIGTVVFDSDFKTLKTNDDYILQYWLDDNFNLRSEYGSTLPAYVYNENATISRYVDRYKIILETNYKIDIDKVRLISYEELTALGCNGTNKTCITDIITNNNRQWTYSTSYWIGSTDRKYRDANLSITSFGDIGAIGTAVFNIYQEGVRPVIEILKSEFT